MPFPPKSPVQTPGTGDDLTIGSASTSGRMIAVAATSSPGTLLHTVASARGAKEQRIVVWASNIDTVTRELTIEWGGTSTSDRIVVTLGSKRGLIPVIPDLKLMNGLEVRAFASSANKINCYVSVGEPTKSPCSRVASGT